MVVKFKVQFTKPDYLEIGQVSYVAGTNKSNGWSQFFTPQYLTLGLNNTGFSDLREYTIYASDYSVNSLNNYLSAIVQQTTGAQVTKYILKKKPQFTLISNVNSVNCGSTTPVNFTMQNIDNIDVSYNWYIGDGWLLPNGTSSPATITTTTNTLSLTPVSFPLSSINVTPIYNGNSLAVRSKTITLASFTTTSQITGSGVVCPGGTATFNLSDSGSFANVTWNIPEFGVAAIENSTNSSVTVEALTSGTFTIYAVVTNECGQTQTIPRTLKSGVPTVNPFYNTISGMYNGIP